MQQTDRSILSALILALKFRNPTSSMSGFLGSYGTIVNLPLLLQVPLPVLTKIDISYSPGSIVVRWMELSSDLLFD